MRQDFPDGVDSRWRHGHCYPMALALSDVLSWPVAALTVTLENGRRGRGPHVVHAWVRAPDGLGFDAGGFFGDDDVRQEFLARTSRKFFDPRIDEFADARAFESYLDACYGHEAEWRDWAPHLRRLREEAERVARALLREKAELALAGPCPK